MTTGEPGTAGGSLLRVQLRSALTGAMKARDRQTVSVLRAVLAAIDNAEAVDIGDHRGGAVEAAPIGPGSAEVERRDLDENAIAEIVRAEIADRVSAASGYEAAGCSDRAAVLRAEAATLASFV
ncbi:hypothetical protein [Nocardia sp. NBC_01329]|uniref:hypothetical protein n=1 Tax=Nocardia sp. NBC_01329 TaxID=2903594 RepID=UPI002E11EF65|nr:GatB/YqeY domain-containing protein [Nocardia sp. NBC_01329]